MELNFSFILPLIILIVIAVIGYVVIMKMQTLQINKKRKMLSTVLNERERELQEQTEFQNWLQKNKILKYMSPIYIMQESEKYGAKINKKTYLSNFMLGVGLGIVISVVYFHPVIYLMPVIALLGGVVATNIKLHNSKKEYIHLLDSSISIYMTSLATALQTFSNLPDSLRSILPTLEQPISKDVEEAMMYLANGKDARIAFKKMNEKYPQKELKHFNDQLDVVVRSGSYQNDTLRNLAYKMKKKATYRRKLKTSHRQGFKAWRTFVFFILSVPFLFIFISWDHFLTIMNSLVLSIVYTLSFIMIFVTYRKLEELEVYDPTNDDAIKH